MDVRDTLRQLPEPDPEGEERVWQRFQATRRARPASRRWVWAGLGLGAAVAAVASLVLLTPEGSHTVVLASESTASHDWSPQVDLSFEGQGEIAGTGKNAEIHWRSGTVTAEVEPNSGTHLTVITDEARVEVVGTVFSVTRDRLGVTTEVQKGKVAVLCTDGWEGLVTAETGPHTCLPTRPALLLGRADALLDQGAEPRVLMQTLDAGLAAAERDSAVASELLVRRMHAFGDQGSLDGVLKDAEAYLAGPGSRRTEVQRYAAYQALQARDCKTALPYLSALEIAGTPQDRVLLAECLTDTQPSRSRALLEDALPHLDASWQDRARRTLERVAP